MLIDDSIAKKNCGSAFFSILSDAISCRIIFNDFLFSRAQNFFLLNINAMARALYIGLFAAAASPTLLRILMFTKQSSTPALAYRRYKANALHTQAWYRHPIKPGSK